MSRPDDIDQILADLASHDSGEEPIYNPVDYSRPKPSRPPQTTAIGGDIHWQTYINAALVAAVCFFAIMWLRTIDGGPGPVPKVKVDRLHVLMVSSDGTGSEEQNAAMDSVIVREWCDKNDVPFRKYDKRDDLTKEEHVWRELMAIAGSAPAMVTASPRRTAVQITPSGPEATVKVLEGLK